MSVRMVSVARPQLHTSQLCISEVLLNVAPVHLQFAHSARSAAYAQFFTRIRMARSGPCPTPNICTFHDKFDSEVGIAHTGWHD